MSSLIDKLIQEISKATKYVKSEKDLDKVDLEALKIISDLWEDTPSKARILEKYVIKALIDKYKLKLFQLIYEQQQLENTGYIFLSESSSLTNTDNVEQTYEELKEQNITLWASLDTDERLEYLKFAYGINRRQ